MQTTCHLCCFIQYFHTFLFFSHSRTPETQWWFATSSSHHDFEEAGAEKDNSLVAQSGPCGRCPTGHCSPRERICQNNQCLCQSICTTVCFSSTKTKEQIPRKKRNAHKVSNRHLGCPLWKLSLWITQTQSLLSETVDAHVQLWMLLILSPTFTRTEIGTQNGITKIGTKKYRISSVHHVYKFYNAPCQEMGLTITSAGAIGWVPTLVGHHLPVTAAARKLDTCGLLSRSKTQNGNSRHKH